MSDSSTQQTASGTTLAAILTSLQQGVIAINNLTQTMKTIFPSS